MGIIRTYHLLLLCSALIALSSCEVLRPSTGTDVTVVEPDNTPDIPEPPVVGTPEETTEEILTPVDSLPAPVNTGAGTRMQVALLMPFSLDEKSLHALEKRDVGKRNRPFIGLAFYEGALLALDSLRAQGVQLDLMVYDSRNSAEDVRRITAKPEFRGVDLIIGPVFPSEVKQAAQYAAEKGIPIISPFLTPSEVTNDPTFYATNPGIPTLCGKMAEYARVAHRSAEFYIVRRNDAEEARAAQEIISGLGTVLGDSVKEIVTDFNLEGVPDTLFSVLPAVFFVPSRDEIFVTAASRALSTLAADQDVTVFGLETWKKFENIPPDYFEKMQLHFPSSYWVDEYAENNRFATIYERKYAAPPSNYAFRGYDLMLYFGMMLHKHGTELSSNLLYNPSFSGMQGRFMFRPGLLGDPAEMISTENGIGKKSYINQHASIVKYSEYRFEVVR